MCCRWSLGLFWWANGRRTLDLVIDKPGFQSYLLCDWGKLYYLSFFFFFFFGSAGVWSQGFVLARQVAGVLLLEPGLQPYITFLSLTFLLHKMGMMIFNSRVIARIDWKWKLLSRYLIPNGHSIDVPWLGVGIPGEVQDHFWHLDPGGDGGSLRELLLSPQDFSAFFLPVPPLPTPLPPRLEGFPWPDPDAHIICNFPVSDLGRRGEGLGAEKRFRGNRWMNYRDATEKTPAQRQQWWPWPLESMISQQSRVPREGQSLPWALCSQPFSK
jgi:hypothetical protein